MRTLIFVQNLKQTLMEVDSTGGNPIFFVQPDHRLAQELKAYAISRLREDISGTYERKVSHFVNDLLSRNIFNLRLRYCLIKLREFSIEETEYLEYIKKAIDYFIKGKHSSVFNSRTPTSIDDLIVSKVSQCFQAWYRPDDVYRIDFAEERQLIFRNPKDKNWSVSNLGEYLLQLSPFETIAFLVALEVVMTLEFHRSSFISKQVVEELLNGDSTESRPYSLRLFGIVAENYYGKSELSDFGQKVLHYVKQNLSLLRDIVLVLLESEATGLKYTEKDDWESALDIFERSKILLKDQKDSIERAISLHRNGDYIDGLRIIYPIIEGTLDSALAAIDFDVTKLRGLQNKAEKLASEGFLSTKHSMALELFTSRNKILHGNILENDPELMKPLFSLVLSHLKSIVLELDDNVSQVCISQE